MQAMFMWAFFFNLFTKPPLEVRGFPTLPLATETSQCAAKVNLQFLQLPLGFGMCGVQSEHLLETQGSILKLSQV